MSFKEAKITAKEKLKSNWSIAIVTFIIYTLANAALSSTGLGSFLLSSALLISLYSVHIGISCGFKEDYDRLLDGFRGNFGSRILLSVFKNIFIALWSLLFFIPGIVKTYSYALAELISYKDENKSWKECIDESRQIMDGHKMDLFLFDLSFILWHIAAVFTCGLLYVYVMPYLQQARIEYINKNIMSL